MKHSILINTAMQQHARKKCAGWTFRDSFQPGKVMHACRVILGKGLLLGLLLLVHSVAVSAQADMAEMVRYCQDSVDEHPDSVLALCARIEQLARAHHSDQQRFTALKWKANALGRIGIFDEALKALYDMTRMLEVAPALDSCGETYNNMAMCYEAMSDFGHGLQFALQYRRTARQNHCSWDTVRAGFEIGLMQVGLGDTSKGLQEIRNQINVAHQLGDTRLLMLGYDDLANAYFMVNRYEDAFAADTMAIQFIDTTADLLSRTGAYEHLALLCIHTKRWIEARRYATKALELATQLNNNNWLYECYRDWADIEEAAGHHQQALQWHRKYVATKDSVYAEAYNQRFAAMTQFYQLENKEKTISLLAARNGLQRSRIIQLSALLVVLVLLGIIAALAVRIYQNKKTKRLEREFSRQLIKSQEDERLRISKELHDSIGQHLLFIRNQIRRNGAEAQSPLVNSLDMALEEVRDIAKNLYPNQLEKYGLVSSVQALAEQINAGTGVFATVDMQLDEQRLQHEQQIACYRVIQEAVSNTLRHAEATALRITATMDQQTLTFVVQDNGKGFSQQVRDRKAHRSFGLLSMEERVRLLRGQIAIESHSGTRITVQLPLKQ
ncbi:MAG: tetratricopeptide repeat protein [Chitinophagales bacterium]